MLKEQIVICWSETCDRQPNNNSSMENKRYFFILIVRFLLKFWEVAICNGVFEYKGNYTQKVTSSKSVSRGGVKKNT